MEIWFVVLAFAPAENKESIATATLREDHALQPDPRDGHHWTRVQVDHAHYTMAESVEVKNEYIKIS